MLNWCQSKLNVALKLFSSSDMARPYVTISYHCLSHWIFVKWKGFKDNSSHWEGLKITYLPLLAVLLHMVGSIVSYGNSICANCVYLVEATWNINSALLLTRQSPPLQFLISECFISPPFQFFLCCILNYWEVYIF